MIEPWLNLNRLGEAALGACIVGLPWWLLGAISGKLYFVIVVFFLGMLVLSTWADSQKNQS